MDYASEDISFPICFLTSMFSSCLSMILFYPFGREGIYFREISNHLEYFCPDGKKSIDDLDV